MSLGSEKLLSRALECYILNMSIALSLFAATTHLKYSKDEKTLHTIFAFISKSQIFAANFRHGRKIIPW